MTLKKYYCILTRGKHIKLDKTQAPSLDDAITTLEDNGETMVLSEFDTLELYHLLAKEFGEPTYKVEDIKNAEHAINYAVKHGYLTEEKAEELLRETNKAFGWLHKCVI